ncbi:MAG: antitoxin [Ignavibacteria bacterium]|nr:antitoxin [Ignavibacteria bacterium]
MEKQIKIFLSDILESIQEIESYFVNNKHDFYEFEQDIRTKRAVERNLEIIGEAVNRILKINPELQLSGSRYIVDLRNRIIHNYDNISYEIIWGIIIKYIPILKEEVLQLFN